MIQSRLLSADLHGAILAGEDFVHFTTSIYASVLRPQFKEDCCAFMVPLIHVDHQVDFTASGFLLM